MNVAARFDPTEPMRERVRRPYARIGTASPTAYLIEFSS
jgi:hypothetical protein